MFSSILRKGLLIVLVPFLINVAWMGCFWLCLQRSASKIEITNRDSSVIILVSRAVALLTGMMINTMDYIKQAEDPILKAKVEADGQTLFSTLKELAAEEKHDPSIGPLTQRLSESVTAFGDQVRILSLSPNLTDLDYRKLMPEERFAQVWSDITQLMATMQARDTNLQEAVAIGRQQIHLTRLVTLIGLLLNFLVAVILVLFFQKHFCVRISELTRRAYLLTTFKYEQNALEGSDELSQLDREILAAGRQLQSAQEFRKSFMTIVAKRLQGPLENCIQTATELSDKESGLDDEESKNQLNAIKISTSTCLSLMQDMLLLQGLQSGHLLLNRQATDIRTTVENAITLVSNLILARQISIENLVQSTTVQMDAARILQVQVNLLANAIKFSPAGSAITVSCTSKQGRIRISTADRGPGMNESVRERLFRKFFQGERGKSVGGTGLGLAVAKLIIDAHDGQIGVESQPGQGSTFWFELKV